MSQREVEEENDHNWKDWRTINSAYFILGLCGEVGELANNAKKYQRYLLGWKGSHLTEKQFIEKLRGELADIQIYLDLIAGKYGFNIEELVREKQKENRERFGWKNE